MHEYAYDALDVTTYRLFLHTTQALTTHSKKQSYPPHTFLISTDHTDFVLQEKYFVLSLEAPEIMT